MRQRPWTHFSLLLLLLLAAHTNGSTASSTLLRHTGSRAMGRLAAPLRQRQAVLQRARVVQHGAFAPMVGRSTVSSGFRQFSQRATRLQIKLQKNVSFKAIFGDVSDVYTNNNDGASSVGADRLRRTPLLISSVTTLVAVTAGEALGGFLGGYVLGAVTHSSQKLYTGVRQTFFHSTITNTPRPLATVSSTLLPYQSLTTFSKQSLRFHAHNMAWAMEWAKISAVFGACRMLVKTARGQSNEEDDGWNSVAGSAMAGALLVSPTTRRIAPIAMARGALLYGGTMFLLHPDLWQQGMEALWLTPPQPPCPVLMEGEEDKGLRSVQIQQPWYDTIDL